MFGDIFVIETIQVYESLKNLNKSSKLEVKNKNMRALSLLCWCIFMSCESKIWIDVRMVSSFVDTSWVYWGFYMLFYNSRVGVFVTSFKLQPLCSKLQMR